LDVRALLEIADMFRFRLDPPTLACLAEQPYRFRALAKELGDRIADRVEDNALSRSLDRLRREGLAVARPTMVGRRTVATYCITDKGLSRLDRYRALANSYQETAPSGGAAHRSRDERPALPPRSAAPSSTATSRSPY